MNIVIFDDLPEGGAKRVVFEQIKGLSKHHEISYITNVCPSIFPFEKYVTVTRFDLNLADYSGWRRPLRELSYYFKLRPVYKQIVGLINTMKPDIVLVHPSRFSQAPILLTSISQPTIYFAEEWLRLIYEPELHPLPFGLAGVYEFMRRRWLQWIDYTATKAATKVICTSQYMKRMVWRAYRRRATVVPLGVDTALFKPATKQKNRDYFLFVGEKEFINGYPLAQTAEDAFEINYVRFKKNAFRYTDIQMAELYQGAVATLCLSVDEPFGLAAIESIACGTPVIAVRGSGYDDTVPDPSTGSGQATGILIDRSSDQLIAAMKQLWDKRGSTVQMPMQFTWDRHILSMEGIFSEVLS